MKRLTNEQRDLFLHTHNRHMKSMGTENQKKYSLQNVKKVIWDKKENCLKVYYEDTWWHYNLKGQWY